MSEEALRIYLADLSAYNAGHLVGEWVTLPANEDKLTDVIERLGHHGMSDVVIHDWEFPKPLSETDSPYEVNRWASVILRAREEGTPDEVIRLVLSNESDGIKILEAGDYTWIEGTMEDWAYDSLEERLSNHEDMEFLMEFFDFKAYAKALKAEGRYYEGDAYCVEVFS